MLVRESLRGETGAGTVLAVGLIGAIVLAFGLGHIAFSFTYTRMQNQSIADQIAVAASDSLRGLSEGFPCEVATSLANRNRVTLDECRIAGFEVFIRIHTDALAVEVSAKARAGPS